MDGAQYMIFTIYQKAIFIDKLMGKVVVKLCIGELL